MKWQSSSERSAGETSRVHATKSRGPRISLESVGIKPSFDPDTDELQFGNYWQQEIPKKATALRWLLALFQDAGWPWEVPVKSRGKRNFEKARNAVAHLNKNLAKKQPRLHFCWNGTGDGICCYVIGLKAAK